MQTNCKRYCLPPCLIISLKEHRQNVAIPINLKDMVGQKY